MNERALRSAFTMVELLVVVFIIGVLIALLVPAIQRAREAARRAQCQSHLKQLALAALTHHEQIGHFPTGGWSARWVGDRDRGFDGDQPGGWAYNVLPYLEESALHDLAGDGMPEVITEEQLLGAGKLAETAVTVMYCPSRRAAIPYPHAQGRDSIVNARLPELVAKVDYVINGGDLDFGGGTNSAPSSLGAARWYPWCNDKIGNYLVGTAGCLDVDPRYRLPSRPPLFLNGPTYSGISFQRSEVEDRHVTDGTSRTYLIGEKTMNPVNYFEASGDDCAAWTGVGDSVTYSGSHPPSQDFGGSERQFGSAHPSGFHMAFCDGSVRVVTYDVDLYVHVAGMHRADGTIPWKKWDPGARRPRN